MGAWEQKPMTFRLDPVRLPQNVMFDLPMWLTMHLYLMGALEGFDVRSSQTLGLSTLTRHSQSWDAIEKSATMVIVIKEAFLKEPLYVLCNIHKTVGLTTYRFQAASHSNLIPGKVMTGDNIANGINNLAMNTGVALHGLYGWRRNACIKVRSSYTFGPLSAFDDHPTSWRRP
jgi:hypothetical protein